MSERGDNPIHSLLTSDAIDRVKRLELFSRQRVRGGRIGENRSTVLGLSPEFVHHRGYMRGDNPRHIDWRVFARTNRLAVKKFEEFTNTPVTIIIDTSGSMGYRGVGETKLSFAMHAAAIVAYIGLLRQDTTSLAEFSDRVAGWIEPGSGRRHLTRLFERLVNLEPAGPTRIIECVESVRPRLRAPGVVVVLSDFMDDPEAIAVALGKIRAAGHDVIAFQVYDPSESDLDYVDFTQFIDLEDNSTIGVDPLLIRQQYRELFEAHGKALRTSCHAAGVDYEPLPVSDDFDLLIADYLRRRAATPR